MSEPVVCKCGDELQADDGAICGACLQPEIAEAEERGRRAGIEEAANAIEECIGPIDFEAGQRREAVAAQLQYGREVLRGAADRIRRELLAPRDSGKEDRK